jgi:FeS assembly SUF system protein
MMTEDIEHLKKNKIAPPESEKRNLLPTIQETAAPPEPPEIEAYGGTGISPTGAFDKEAMNTFIIATLKCIYDPEIPINIYDLGLIYDIAIDDEAVVDVTMTLTAPGCPVADTIVREVADRVGLVPGVKHSHVQLSWDPPWTKDRMSEEAMLELGLL